MKTHSARYQRHHPARLARCLLCTEPEELVDRLLSLAGEPLAFGALEGQSTPLSQELDFSRGQMALLVGLDSLIPGAVSASPRRLDCRAGLGDATLDREICGNAGQTSRIPSRPEARKDAVEWGLRDLRSDSRAARNTCKRA
jgi:hypothetical protein